MFFAITITNKFIWDYGIVFAYLFVCVKYGFFFLMFHVKHFKGEI